MSRTRVRWARVAVAVLVCLGLLWAAGQALSAAEQAPVERYRVRDGDTLWAIARRRVGPVGDPRPVVADIREANGLATSALESGQTILLPVG